jgi:hypothetical protein
MLTSATARSLVQPAAAFRITTRGARLRSVCGRMIFLLSGEELVEIREQAYARMCGQDAWSHIDRTRPPYLTNRYS